MHPIASKALLLVLLIASPWLLVQGWIVVGAQDESISSMEACPEASANCAHLGGNADYRMDVSSTFIDRSMEDIRSELSDYMTEYDCKILVEDASDSLYMSISSNVLHSGSSQTMSWSPLSKSMKTPSTLNSIPSLV